MSSWRAKRQSSLSFTPLLCLSPPHHSEPTQPGPALPASGSISNTPTFLPLNSIIHIFHTITTRPFPIIHPSLPSHLLISPLDPSIPPPSTVSPRRLVERALVIRAGSSPRALAQDQSGNRGQPLLRLAPPRSGAGSPPLPGLQLEERRLE